MKIIKCSGLNCNKQYEEEDENVVSWYCKPCMERVMGNMKSWLESDTCKAYERKFWEEVGQDSKKKPGYYTRIR